MAAIQSPGYLRPYRALQLAPALASPGVISFFVFTATELSLGLVRQPLQPRHPAHYLLSILSSAALWLLLARLWRALPARLGWLWAGIVGFCAATLLVASALTYVKFGQFITGDMLSFIWDDPRYLLDFILSLLVGHTLAGHLLAIAAFTWVWRPNQRVTVAPRRPARPRWAAALGWIFLWIFCIASVAAVGLTSNGRHHRIETTYLFALPQSIVDQFTDRKRLYAAERAPVEPLEAAQQPPWSILFIYNESLASEHVFADPAAAQPFRSGMPRLTEWLRAERDRSVIFERAFTNSGATNVSIPSLLTGVAADAPVELLHDAPLPWHWARAAGLRSIFVTSQRYSWANFDAFFFSSPPDIRLTAAELNAPIVNDTGVDDMIAAEALIHELDAVPTQQPVLAILGTNAAHYPFQNDSDRVELPADLPRHARAVRIVDHAIAEVLDALQRSGRLDRTIVVMTSDHGAKETLRHAPRIFSFYDEITRIPVFLRLPQALIDAHPEYLRALRGNRGELVQNMDIVPTLVDLLGLSEAAQNKQILQRLSGQSLLKPVSPDRILTVLNTNDIRTWHSEGFGIYWDRDRRFVFTNISGPKLYDVSQDPQQTRDLWPQVDPATDAHLRAVIAQNRHLKRMFEAWEPLQ